MQKIQELQPLRSLLLLFSCYIMPNSFMTPWIGGVPLLVCQVPLFMGFSRKEEWSGLAFPFPRDFPETFCIGRQILYHWDTREAQERSYIIANVIFKKEYIF